jgi:Alpha/beta hydrolase domain
LGQFYSTGVLRQSDLQPADYLQIFASKGRRAMTGFRTIPFALAVLAVPQIAFAQQAAPSVVLEITSRAPAFGGQSFGEYGSYETITGKARMRIDPRAAANRGIVDLALAPRDADGLVSYDVDFVIQRPADPAKARRVMFYDVVNRGMQMVGRMAGGSFNPNDAGDGLLQRQGLTLVWSGWQGDIGQSGAPMLGTLPPGVVLPKLIAARFPVATDKGKPITGRISTEAIFDNLTSNTMTLPYPVGDDNPSSTQLTVRAVTGSALKVIPAADWRFTDGRHIEIKRPAEMDAGAIYRFEYVAKDPVVMGLGFAATRDLIAYLRKAPAAQGNPLADIGPYQSAVAFGGSQSGRYLRDFLWQGFNRDLTGARVFDGVIPFIPGARRTFTNFRFAEPGRFSRQHEDHDVPGFTFPFSYSTLRDPVTGISDGILKSCTASKTCPKIFHIDTSAEFWQAGAALVGTGGTDRDVAPPPNVRTYMIAGGSHAPGMMMPACRYGPNSLNYSAVVRAMLVAMVDWTTKGNQPPPSRWPLLSKGDLVDLGTFHQRVPIRQSQPPSYRKPWPSPGTPVVPAAALEWPRVMNRPIPPEGKGDWPAYVPKIDADGNDIAGIRLPAVALPEGTYLGWNLRKAGYGEGDLCLLAGSYVPFAQDAASRGGDTRPSLAERYPAPEDRQAQLSQAIQELRKNSYLLNEDATKMQSTQNGSGTQ